MLLERAAENESFIDKLKGISISLALDDFGTGYSSLRSLTAFPFNKIKIDKSFIANLSVREESAAVISSVVTLARGLGIQITAEGVETEEQLRHLCTLGVNFAQGYLLGRPMPVEQLEQHLEITRAAPETDELIGEALEEADPRSAEVVALIPRSGAPLSFASNG